MITNNKLIPYDEEILYLMYVSIFNIAPKYLVKASHINENKEAAIVFFGQEKNLALLKDHYGKLSCVTAK